MLQSFKFLNPGLMVDGELELVTPQHQYVDDVMNATRHSLTLKESPELARMTRENLLDFLKVAPQGQHLGSTARGSTPSYHFWMKTQSSPLKIAGGLRLRIGDTVDIVQYIGHIGYQVYPAARGHHLAERSCRLLLPLARLHGMKTIWITCNPDNIASRRTCERLGATLVEIVPVPQNHELWSQGDFQKCRYRIDL